MSKIKANRYENTATTDGGIDINTSGSVGIGTASPTSKFDVEIASNTGINFTNLSTAPIIDFKANAVESAGRIQVNEASGGGVMQFATKTTGGTVTERARIDSSGRLLLGTSSSRAISGLSSQRLQIEGTDGTGSCLSIINNQNSVGRGSIRFGKSRGTSLGSNTIVADGDTLGDITWSGADGTDLASDAASIKCKIDGTPGSNDMPGRLVFSTTADGASSATERFQIGSNGLLQSHSEGSTTMKPMLGCRAFCCFKGTGTVAIFSSFNVSSVTDLGTGSYRVNFSNSMIDSNYGITTGFQRNGVDNEFLQCGFANSTGAFSLEFFDSGAVADCARLTAVVHR